MEESSGSSPLSKENFYYQFGVLSFSLVARHLNFAYMLTTQTYYFVFRALTHS